jgi:hypothetical protein
MMVSVNNRQLTCVGVESKLIGIGAELYLRSDKSDISAVPSDR